MEKTCLLIAHRDSLFRQLVANLLNGLARGFKLRESQAVDIKDLLREVAQDQPNIILLENSFPFVGDVFLFRLLTSQPDRPVIVISENSNEMHMLRCESVLLSSSMDLVNAIEQIQTQTETQNL